MAASEPASSPEAASLAAHSKSLKIFLEPTQETIKLDCLATDLVEEIIRRLYNMAFPKLSEPDEETLKGFELSVIQQKAISALARGTPISTYDLDSDAKLVFKSRKTDPDGPRSVVKPLTLRGNQLRAPSSNPKQLTNTESVSQLLPSHIRRVSGSGPSIPAPHQRRLSDAKNKKPSPETLELAAQRKEMLEQELKAVPWLVCGICDEVVAMDKIENHVRFCKDTRSLDSEAKKDPINLTPAEDDDDDLVHKFWRIYDELFHLVVCACICYMVGSWGASFLLAGLIYYFIYHWDLRLKMKEWRRKFVMWSYNKKQVHEPERLGIENSKFLNEILARAWPSMSPMMDVSLTNLTNTTMNNPLILEKAKVNKFVVQKWVLGLISPVLTNIRAIRLPDVNKFKANLDFFWNPHPEIIINAEIGLVKVPIRITDVKIFGRMHLTLEFVPEPAPFIDHIQVGFLDHPQVDVVIQVLNMVDVMDVAFLSPFMNKLIQDSVANLLVLPEFLTMSLKEIYGPPRPPEQQPPPVEILQGVDYDEFTQSLASRFFHPEIGADRVRDFINQFVTQKKVAQQERARTENKTKKKKKEKKDEYADLPPTSRFDSAINLEKLMRQEKKIQSKRIKKKALLENKPKIGVLKVKLIAGKDLEREGGFLVTHTPSPYVILKVGSTFHKSITVNNTKSPEWYQFFDFEVREGDKKRLYIQVMSQRSLAKDDEFLGREMVDFTELDDDEKAEMWIHIHGAKGRTGQVFISMTYVPVIKGV